jgi:hypothetical protein
MKDKECRELAGRCKKSIDLLADRMGVLIKWDQSGVIDLSYGLIGETQGRFNLVADQLANLGRRIAALEELAKPVCKTCGQKIKVLPPGSIEAIAAEVKKKK